MEKMLDYNNMNEAQLVDIYINRCRQQGASAGVNIPKTKSRLIQAIMEKDVLLAVGNALSAGDNKDGEGQIIIVEGGTN